MAGKKLLKKSEKKLWNDPESQQAFPGIEKVEIAKLSGETVVVKDCKAMTFEDQENKKKREYYLCLADWGDREVVFSTGVFMTRQLRQYLEAGGEFPAEVKIEKVHGKRYYRFSEP